MELFERDGDLAVFADALADAERGIGSVLLVAGEAGIGKTSLIRELARRAERRARVLVGSCDDLLTPRTLGPLRDMPLRTTGPLRRALSESADRDTVLAAALEEFHDPLRPTIVVVEDAHWADEATRDTLVFLGRRVGASATLLVVTYRDDLPADHPLRTTLGALTGPAVRRIALRPLSDAALAVLAGDRAIPVEQLRHLTGGNPFLVTEVLAAPDSDLPSTVRDAVAARARDLPPSGRAAATLLAVAPGGVELAVLRELLPDALVGVAAAEQVGLVEVEAGRARFRHELLRRAVEATHTAIELADAHGRLLHALERRDADPARLVHHAAGVGDAAALVTYAPTAARRAAGLGGHRDAVALLERALEHADRLTPEDEADVLRWYAFELYLTNRHVAGMDAAERAVATLERTGPPVTLGKALVLLSHVSCWAARPDRARGAAIRAIEVLEPSSDHGALALAHANRSFIEAMAGSFVVSAEQAERALALVDRHDLAPVRPYALIQLGAARSLAGDADGEALLCEGLDRAPPVGPEYVPLACTWLCMSALRHGRPDEVETWAAHGIGFSEDRQLDIGVTTLRMLLHELQVHRGEWSEAESGLAAIVADPHATGWGHSVACTLLGRLRARRGVPDARDLLERGWALALQADEPERIARAGAAWYEWALLHGDGEVLGRAERAVEVARAVGNPWLLGDLLRWQTIVSGGRAPRRADEVCEPWASGLAGAWQRAAAGWDALGWPFERAWELVASGEVDLMFEALATFDRLGAAATARWLRGRLRDRGVRRVPRGPARETRANPFGLTGRQAEVLALVAEGLTNAQIAARLVVSVRTVDHHVSAVLGKLGASSRVEAAEMAVALERDAAANPSG